MASSKKMSTFSVEISESCSSGENVGDEEHEEMFTDNCNMSMELDSEYNSGRTIFPTNTNAYFKVYTANNINMYATFGIPNYQSISVLEKITEYVSFSNYTANLSKPFYTSLIYEWVGNYYKAILANKGSTALYISKHNNGDGYGYAQVTYYTRFIRGFLYCGAEGDIIVYCIGEAECSDQKSSLTLSFRDKGVEEDIDTTIIVKNFISGEVIPGAYVKIDGIYKGLTDNSGRIYLGKLSAGNHNVFISKAGFSSTSGDGLDNDTIIIPEG